jgi:hypothetical protein
MVVYIIKRDIIKHFIFLALQYYPPSSYHRISLIDDYIKNIFECYSGDTYESTNVTIINDCINDDMTYPGLYENP